MGKWRLKKDLPDGDRLEKIVDRKTKRTVPLPIKMKGRAKQDVNTIVLFKHKKRYPAVRISFNGQVNAEALDGKKIMITIDVIE